MKVGDKTKRAVDVIGATVALTAASPIIIGAAIAVKAAMGRPVIFRQRRSGLGGEPFVLTKFRTMREPKPGKEFLESDKVRLGRIGMLLRRLSIDELPTLINVIKGDMSLVGPRPLLMQYLDRYSPEQLRRHEVKPGITGWAQVNGRNAISWEEKFRYDVWYVDNQNLMLDMKILVMTVMKVLKREGISQAGEVTMTEFMGTKENEE